MQAKYEDANGVVYVSVESGYSCEGCAFDEDPEGCQQAPVGCTVEGSMGETFIWIKAE